MIFTGEQDLGEGGRGPRKGRGAGECQLSETEIRKVRGWGEGHMQQPQLIPAPHRVLAGSLNVEQMELCRWSAENPLAIQKAEGDTLPSGKALVREGAWAQED